MRLEQVPTKGALPLTAAPANRQSFFAEFYTVEHSPAKARRKAGLFKRFSTLVRRTAQKVNFFD